MKKLHKILTAINILVLIASVIALEATNSFVPLGFAIVAFGYLAASAYLKDRRK